jgi:hypothetical protein
MIGETGFERESLRKGCLLRVIPTVFTVSRSLPIYHQLQTCRCTALTDGMCQPGKSLSPISIIPSAQASSVGGVNLSVLAVLRLIAKLSLVGSRSPHQAANGM